MQKSVRSKVTYVFIDEGGNLDFSPSGTKYFTLTSVRTLRPFPFVQQLTELRFDLIESGLDIEYFHASEERQVIRDKVFSIIQGTLKSFRVDCVIVDKCKTAPSLRELKRFYPKMLGYLLNYVVKATDLSRTSEFIIMADRLPNKKKRRAVERAVKTTFSNILPDKVRYQVIHHDSKSYCGLQIADYFNWAIYRAWDSEDSRSLDLVRQAVASQFDIFRWGMTKYY